MVLVYKKDDWTSFGEKNESSVSGDMVGYLANYVELNTFLFGAKHFPERTPNRWDLISEFVRGEAVKELICREKLQQCSLPKGRMEKTSMERC